METNYPPGAVVLNGTFVDLIPLKIEHLSDLKDAVQDGELWKLWYTMVPSPENMESWIQKSLEDQKEKLSVPFVVIRKNDGKLVGSTRYMNIEKEAKRLEIGTTWYSKNAQRSVVNTECKLLLLQYAFETLECIAVEFRTHFFNSKSRKAIERIGAKLDGILRSHRVSSNGTLRDTVVYSIIQNEWPVVKAHLRFKLETA